jgi:ribose transport system substrate-binding protein
MRRTFAVLAVGFALLLSGCGAGGPDAKYQIAVVPKSVSFEFWTRVEAGAKAAATEMDSTAVRWKGTSDESDVAGQVRILESFINQGVDAIVVAATDSKGIVPTLREAEKQGIPVITIDSGTEPQISRSLISTNNARAAGKAADLIAEATGGEGQVALIPYVAGASTSNAREKGFKRHLQQYEGLKLVTTRYSNSSYSRAMTVTEDILTSYPNLDAIFAANEPSAVGTAQALKSRGKAGEVTLVGFDASPREIEGMRSGTIHGLIVQNPYRMGYHGVKQAMRAIKGKPVEKRIDSGSIVVTNENLDQFLARRKQRKSGKSPAPADTGRARSDTSRGRSAAAGE